jgi:hypothetical protein
MTGASAAGAVPDDVVITNVAREPVTDSTVGIPVALAPSRGTPRNRLVAVGDSLTHGFQSGAIFHTDLSYPAIIARELGWFEHFRFPRYPGFGGIPLNLEFLIADLEHRFGDEISWWELPLAAFHVRQHLAEAEQWWDLGPGSKVPAETGINHNLGIYGWDLRDALVRTADTAAAEWRAPEGWRIVPLIRNADAISALRVLESARDEHGEHLTPLAAAAALGAEGTEETPERGGDPGDGIETLIVFLGANNALGTVISLSVRWSGPGYDDLREKSAFNVWRPSHFQAELRRVADEVRSVRARHVIWGTVPHVTIAPIARGVGGKMRRGSRYFHFYTRPWISDRDFNESEDPHLTGDDARAIDSAIDQYNDAIVETVRAGRREGRDWRLLDVCGVLDRLAYRRYIADPEMRPPSWWSPYPLPLELVRLTPPPDTRFFCSGAGGRTAGGLIALDGIHPTTIAYGVLAQEFIDVMADAGVVFRNARGEPRDEPGVDFGRLLTLDALVSHPPRSLGPDVSLIGWLDQRVDIIKRLWTGIG